jgi:hypothetical protein
MAHTTPNVISATLVRVPQPAQPRDAERHRREHHDRQRQHHPRGHPRPATRPVRGRREQGRHDHGGEDRQQHERHRVPHRGPEPGVAQHGAEVVEADVLGVRLPEERLVPRAGPDGPHGRDDERDDREHGGGQEQEHADRPGDRTPVHRPRSLPGEHLWLHRELPPFRVANR